MSQNYNDSLNDKSTPLTQAQACLEALTMLSKRQIATWYNRSKNPTEGYYAGWDDAEYTVREALPSAQALVDTLSKQSADFEEWKKAKIPNAGAVIHAIAQEAWNDALSKQGDERNETFRRLLKLGTPINMLIGASRSAKGMDIYHGVRKEWVDSLLERTEAAKVAWDGIVSLVEDMQQPTAIAEQREGLRSIREKAALIKQRCGTEMDYGSSSDAVQNGYILSGEVLALIDRMIGGE